MNHTEPDVEELTIVANKFYDQAQDAATGMLEAAWQSGQALVKIKATLKHGEWMTWVKTNFHGSHDTANRYMLLAANYASLRNLSVHPDIDAALKAIRAAKAKPKPKDPAPQPKPAPKADDPVVVDAINEMEAKGESYTARDVVEKVAAQGVKVSVDTVERKRNAVREGLNATPAAWDTIPGTAQEKINREVKRMYKTLEAQLKAKQTEQIKQQVEILVGMQRDALKIKEIRAKHIIDSAKGVVTQDEYNLIRSCLHPDSRASVTDEKLAKAFRVFNTDQIKAVLVKVEGKK